MDALRARRSIRSYRSEPLPPQELSNLLWAACGHNRPSEGTGIFVEGCRTSPTAHNWQEIDVYVATESGVQRFLPESHSLELVHDRDIRALTAHETQPFVTDAPVNLIYVSDTARMDDTIPWDYGVFPWANTTVLVENVYLYCASRGLATVCRGLFGRDALTAALELKPQQLITFHQLVGYPGADDGREQ